MRGGKHRIYRRTAVGEEAVASEDTAIPFDYRRVLRLIEGETHSNVMRGCLRQFPDRLLDDWLEELEEIGFVSSAPADLSALTAGYAAAFEGSPEDRLPAQPEDLRRIHSQADAAVIALKEQGAFLSPDRLANREALAKAPGDIKVLIVEDDPDQAALADLRVSMAGYGVRVAANFRELLLELETRTLPDLVLLDIMLPDRDGFAILAGMRRHPRLTLIPVLMLSVLADRGSVARGIGLGADGYITKPYSKKILAQTIREVLKLA